MRITKRQLRRLIREACSLGPQEEEMPEEAPMLQALPAPEAEMAPEPMAPTSSDVPVPEDYQATRNFLDQNPDMVDLALQGIMDAVGAGCQRSTAQAVVDHMQDLLSGSDEASATAELDQGFAGMIGL